MRCGNEQIEKNGEDPFPSQVNYRISHPGVSCCIYRMRDLKSFFACLYAVWAGWLGSRGLPALTQSW